MPTPRAQLTLAEVEAIAREAHADQRDKAGRPYTEHLAAVAEGVRIRGGSDGQIAAAWLHDAVEDDALSEEWLADAALPQEVKDMVLGRPTTVGGVHRWGTPRLVLAPRGRAGVRFAPGP
ncbi:HD domain-containing protein, partial [Streptomyces sp. NPDC059153]|uniref:HD domain-containing protein n=1 Tax=Streptomyces sp. NPDC059153 TaxID=3346743 RepID=UPI00368476F1